MRRPMRLLRRSASWVNLLGMEAISREAQEISGSTEKPETSPKTAKADIGERTPQRDVTLLHFCGGTELSSILFPKEGRIMQKVQKTYTPEFKREAVRLAQTSGKPITQVARELGISDTSIHQWRKELTDHGREAFPGSGHQTAQEEELRQLKRELERVRQERDILKKAVDIFSRNQP